jgi:hypothetical protein
LVPPEDGDGIMSLQSCVLNKRTVIVIIVIIDRHCGLVVRVLGYRSGGPGSIPGTTRFSDKKKKENK